MPKDNISIGRVMTVYNRSDDFLESLRNNHQQRLLSSITKLRENIQGMMTSLSTTSSGRIEGMSINLKQAQRIHKDLVNEFEKTYGVEVNSLIGSFDDITDDIISTYNDLNVATRFTSTDKDIINQLKNTAYTQFDQFGEAAKERIADAMYGSILSGDKFSDLTRQVEGILEGHQDVRGRPMSQYASTYAWDSIMNFHNQVNTKKGEDAGLSSFLYFGNLISTSRSFCIRRAGNVYTKDEIQAWNDDSWPGKSGPPFIYRGGYNCRHHWRPVKIEWVKGTEQEENIAMMSGSKEVKQIGYDISKKQKSLEKGVVNGKKIKKQMKAAEAKAKSAKRETTKTKYANEAAVLKKRYDKQVISNRKIKEDIDRSRAKLRNEGRKIMSSTEVKQKQKAATIKASKKRAKEKQTISLREKQEKRLSENVSKLKSNGVKVVSYGDGWLDKNGNFDFGHASQQVSSLNTELSRIRKDYVAVDQLMKKFPIEDLRLSRTQYLPYLNGGMARGLYYNGRNMMSLATELKTFKGEMRSLSSVERSILPTEMVPRGRFTITSQTESPITTFRHELGHHAHEHIVIDDKRKWDALFWKRKEIFKQEVSLYSATNPNEAFAESFALFTSKQYKFGMLPKEIEEYMGKVLGQDTIGVSKKVAANLNREYREIKVFKDKAGPMPALAKQAEENYVRMGNEWFYKGEKIIKPEVLDRLNKMRVPPAWDNVVVSVDPAAKIQVIGVDKVGRWQYRYSAEHVAAAAKRKFDRIRSFSEDINSIRKRMTIDMRNEEDLAYLAKLEDLTAIRAGSRTSRKAAKQAYGLTTLKNKHVKIKGDKITLDFTAKEGIPAHYEIRNKEIADWLKGRLSNTAPDDFLFPDMPASKLNKYIKKIANGKSYSVKDFRTFHGTRIAFNELEKYSGVDLTIKQRKQIIKEVTKKVSDFLHNTPTMAKTSYIDPVVWDLIGGLP